MKTKKKGRSTYKLSAQEKECIKVLEGAAEKIITRKDHCLCIAIQNIVGRYFNPIQETIKRIYRADSDRPWSSFYWDWIDSHNKKEVDNPRVFALLFAAEMIRTNSLP